MWPGVVFSRMREETGFVPELRSSTQRPNLRAAGANSRGNVREKVCGATRGLAGGGATRRRTCGATRRERTAGETRRGPHAREAQESTDRAIVPWPGWRSHEGTDSRGEQGFEAGVPAAVSGEPGRFETRTLQTSAATRHAQRPSDSREPSSRPSSPASLHGPAAARGRRAGERGRETLGPCRAVGLVEREPAWKQEARESGYGSSRRESSEGRLQGRERREIKPRSVGAPR